MHALVKTLVHAKFEQRLQQLAGGCALSLLDELLSGRTEGISTRTKFPGAVSVEQGVVATSGAAIGLTFYP